MAVKWAVANGNWSAGTTWNGGTVPQEGDYVYANGKTIQIYSGVNIGNGTLSTEICPNTGISGGRFYSGETSLNITANLKGYNGVYVVWSAQSTLSGNVAITGNIDDYGMSLQGGSAYTLSITGNVSGIFYQSRYASNIAKTVNIVGNVANGARIQTSTDSFNVSVVGNVDLGANFCSNMSLLNRLTINGITRFMGNYIMTRPLTTSGVIDLSQTELTYIPSTSSISFAGQTTIVADYPPENVVKEGVRYGIGLVGTYVPDYPPEGVVMDGYEYARYEVATNNLALYNSTLYLYNGSLWSTIPYLGETTTNVTDSTHSVDPDIDINGVTTTATDGDIVKYGAYYYMWDDANTIWVKTDYYYIGETTTDISGGSTRSQLFIVGESMKGTMIPVNIPQTTLDRLANCVTVDILDAQLNAKL